jgi:hypothetical protein
MNYLHHALLCPDRWSLALYDTYNEAREAFFKQIHESSRLGVVALERDLMFRFSQGGGIRYGQMMDEYEIMRYKGYEWINVFTDKLSKRGLAQTCVAHLIKPVYNGDGNGV